MYQKVLSFFPSPAGVQLVALLLPLAGRPDRNHHNSHEQQ